jgi:ribosomal protein S18 acetylase RimI-like enzyme
MEAIRIAECSIPEAEPINDAIPEFDKGYLQKFFLEKYNERKHLIVKALWEQKAAGYLVAYDRFEDNSIYCWCLGVLPEFRKKGIARQLMQHLENWAKRNGFSKIRVKTENRFREALVQYIKSGYYVTAVALNKKIEKNEVWLEKDWGEKKCI